MTKLRALPSSLTAKMFYASFTGILVGLIVFLAANTIGSAYIDKVYMSPAAVEKRRDAIYSDFSHYVSSHSLSGTDYHAIAIWTDTRSDVTLLIYGQGHKRVHFSAGKIQSGDSLSVLPLEDASLYPVRFSDGLYIVSVNDVSESHVSFLAMIASVALGCLALVVIVIAYANHLTARIVALSREASEVASGDLEHVIPSVGGDEISDLALSMDNMRLSVIRRIGNEKLAWQANNDLITAMSHDIRTPMTSVIAYLGLLSENGFEDKARCRQFVDAAYNKAIELKHLTDELFSYFLVFGNKTPEMHIEELDGQLLFEQVVTEAEYDLRDAGFNVKNLGTVAPCTVRVDTMHLARVMNNLVSNVKKYADPARQVTIYSEFNGSRLFLCVSNYIPADTPRTESTKIGLASCRKIMETMGGAFHTASDDGHFSAELILPASPPQGK